MLNFIIIKGIMMGKNGLFKSLMRFYRGNKNEILVTGGTGFIGTKLVKFLIKNNHEITILTRNKKKINNPRIMGLLQTEREDKNEFKIRSILDSKIQ